MLEQWLAGAVLAACALYGAGLLLGESRRLRLQAWLRRLAAWPRARRDARREAAQAIERARRRKPGREGKVVRPTSFDRRPPGRH